MTYLLETITLADREKIIQDAAPWGKQTWLKEAVKMLLFPKSWAVDRQRNCYMFFMPDLVRTESLEQPYLAFVDGRMYQINLSSMFGQDVYFDEKELPAENAIDALQCEVVAAFAVLGLFGKGPLDELGLPEYEVVPVFKKKGA